MHLTRTATRRAIGLCEESGLLRRAGGLLLCLGVLAGAGQPVSAHFLQLLPDRVVLAEGGQVALELTFTHPFDDGPVMEMARPVRLGRLVGGVIEDLSALLVETRRGGATAWSASVDLVAPGVSQFFVEPAPYWEPAEGKYIVHYAKVMVDSWASGEGWDQPVGLKVEILPLTRPYGLWTGNSFHGIVLREGAPVPFAEIEVEYANPGGEVAAPDDSFVTQVIRADAAGAFVYTMPRAGWWGFAALTEGDEPLAGPDGAPAPVEEGGLIWVQTKDMAGGPG